VLADYNARPDSGLEALRQIRKHALLSGTPVVILTEKTYNEQVQECYRLGANTCICKPPNHEGTKAAIQAFYTYWLETAALFTPTGQS
ncbi:MAG TPA: response regulator, partial [Chitinophagaceae bacterium]|nr:response regulator [Chitinophagaceae bacterium]